ncbi:hypothetical protein STCU_01947 [Strigomonas culicis]|nr:hypothetical protein STCU_01947 [Strigomonas culicis]|eukprot:EPY33819.1 hypothetical protein STCU_01947 [Strigomonas culicis]
MTSIDAPPPGAYEKCHPGPNDRFVSVGPCGRTNVEIVLCYQTFGDPKNPCLLLVPGLGVSLYNYREALLQQYVAKGFYVVVYDNRDSGCSTHLTSFDPPFILRMILPTWASVGEGEPAYTLDDMARDGLRLLDKLNIEKAHLLGASMGGMIVQCMALLAPARVLSLNIVYSHHGGPDVKPQTWGMSLAMLEKPASDTLKDIQDYKVRFAAYFTTDVYPIDEALVRQEVAMLVHRCPDDAPSVGRQMWAIQRAASRVEGLRGLNTPTQRNIPVTIIHGIGDTMVPVENGVQLAKTIAQSKLVVFADMGHAIPPELYDDFVDEVGLHLLHSK